MDPFDSLLLVAAAAEGNISEIQRLIPLTNPKNGDSAALRYAVANGNIDCVKLLLPVSDPKALNSQILRDAVENNQIECLKILLPLTDPKSQDSGALYDSCVNINHLCIELLVDESDAYRVLDKLQKNHPNKPLYQEYLQKTLMDRQRHRLLDAVKDTTERRGVNKIRRL